MDDCWKILGIEPFSDADTIRKAYAALAGKHHPEEDPEGFKRIHEAYRSAIGKTSNQQPSRPTNAKENDRAPDDESFFDNEEESVTEDIKDFKLTNHIMTQSSVVKLKKNKRMELILLLEDKYGTLSKISDPDEVWVSFLSEPLVKPYLIYADVRERIIDQADDRSKRILEILLEDYFDRGQLLLVENEAPKKKEKKKSATLPMKKSRFILLITSLFFCGTTLTLLGIIGFSLLKEDKQGALFLVFTGICFVAVAIYLIWIRTAKKG